MQQNLMALCHFVKHVEFCQFVEQCRNIAVHILGGGLYISGLDVLTADYENTNCLLCFPNL